MPSPPESKITSEETAKEFQHKNRVQKLLGTVDTLFRLYWAAMDGCSVAAFEGLTEADVFDVLRTWNQDNSSDGPLESRQVAVSPELLEALAIFIHDCVEVRDERSRVHDQ